MKPIPARDRLIVALDLPTVAEAEAMVARLGDSVAFFKVGLQLIYAGGVDLARRLAGEGKQVFLDGKLLDIDNTVEGAVREHRAARRDVPHHPRLSEGDARRGRRAGTAAAPPARRHGADLDGRRRPSRRRLCRQRGGPGRRPCRGRKSRRHGRDRRLPAEAAAVRRIVGPDMAIVTPGIRPAGAGSGDQKRDRHAGKRHRRGRRLPRGRPSGHHRR